MRLRISVDPGGCDGFQYSYSLESNEEELQDEDIRFEKNTSVVVTDTTSMDFLRGSTIDFVQEIAKESFAIINNPNSDSACGCGQSFAIKNFTENPAFD